MLNPAVPAAAHASGPGPLYMHRAAHLSSAPEKPPLSRGWSGASEEAGGGKSSALSSFAGAASRASLLVGRATGAGSASFLSAAFAAASAAAIFAAAAASLYCAATLRLCSARLSSMEKLLPTFRIGFRVQARYFSHLCVSDPPSRVRVFPLSCKSLPLAISTMM